SPRICGTAKRPSSAAGAPDSACSWVRVFSTTSSRKTLVMAMGWDVAGTSSVATSDTEPTACMMESTSPAKRSISSSVSWIRARPASRATSSRPIDGIVFILGRGAGPLAHPVVVAADAPEAEAPVEGACGGVVYLDLEQGTAGALHGGERQQGGRDGPAESRSEEHTSELQSRFDLVCRLLLEKKNQQSSR